MRSNIPELVCRNGDEMGDEFDDGDDGNDESDCKWFTAAAAGTAARLLIAVVLY